MRRTHGKSNSRTYEIWCGMIKRCTNRRHKNYDRYGGRGIVVCALWRRFEAFLADMGEAPAGLTIERINNDGNYEPGNCRWATRAEQGSNRRGLQLIAFRGESLPLLLWADRFSLPRSCVRARFDRGWDTERMLTTPPDARFRGKSYKGVSEKRTRAISFIAPEL
jgi:hypothetical protein